MAKRAIEPIVAEKVRLRLLTEADLPTTLAWRNQDEVRKWFFYSDIISPESHAEWFRAYLERSNDFVFIIEDRAHDDRPVGQAALYNIDWEQGIGEYGRLMIGEPWAHGRGLAKAATIAVLSCAEETLRLREVYMEVISDNLPSRGACSAAGFVVESERDGVIDMRKRFVPRG